MKSGMKGGRMWKRAVDLTGAALGLVLALPLLAAAALAIRIGMGAPVLFRQKRGGLRGAIFEIYKFRTMADPETLTPLGAWLRRFGIDELPQLWNILKGDMSLVGPRPLLAEYLTRYDSQQQRRHEIRPGITGLAQIEGGNTLAWNERFKLDVWYVDHYTFALELRILLMTIWKLVSGRGESKPVSEWVK